MMSTPAEPKYVLSRHQSRQVDQIAIQQFGFHSLVLMENAAAGAAREWLRREPDPTSCAIIVCGTGNNGGDGLVMARHLHIAARPVVVILIGRPEQLTPDALANWRILQHTTVPTLVADATATAADVEEIWDQASRQIQPPNRLGWIVDAILGTGATGNLRNPLQHWVQHLNLQANAQRMALDVPTGWDCDTGPTDTPPFQATLTYTFVARKRSFDHPLANQYLGEIVVGSIGIPPEVLHSLANSGPSERA